ncbi:TetR/AcrR family transcriptional regulator [Nocardia bovistercoris]|uniref:TetR family transcriptional regulator n=1 Tax=Nocardia bovistercoris TaxID=2785916 RepID=A0A931N2D9_9NOCA|nr:TetR/AcrR family transcriptional regulator [Nocardia bovistercoris]MBH0776632.1 TetR family transcriptional regulator [Nocardia bovistercoris]
MPRSQDGAVPARARSPRPSSTADTILRCATERFRRHGYTPTSVRAIANDAGVDPALVIRHFGSKEELFLRTVPNRGFWNDVLAGPLATLGTRLVEFLLSHASDEMLGMHTALVRASDSAAVRSKLNEVVEQSFIDQLKDRLPGPDPVLRARLIAAQIGGLLQALSISDETLRDYDHSCVIAVYGRAIQSTATGI